MATGYRSRKSVKSSKRDPLRKKRRTLKHAVFSKSPDICRYLNCQSLFKYFMKPGLRFLSQKELKSLQQEPSETVKANKLLLMLNAKPRLATRKFTACLMLEREHKGHVELSSSITASVTPRERGKLEKLVEAHGSETTTDIEELTERDSVSPQKPITFIYLVGDLSMEPHCSFFEVDRKLWEYFSTANYDSLETFVDRITDNDEAPNDWKVIASWFRALIVMHRDHQYSTCTEEILKPALQECAESENRTILEGRILQRMAQVYLVMNEKQEAHTHFEMAKEKLQFVGRGYDKANMFCRQAKLLSTTCSTQEERDMTEKLYETALDCVPGDASYSLASRPSLIMSKAAFHLHLSFGKRASGSPPRVSDEDLEKAKKTLQCLPEEHIILTIRKCEYSLLKAELRRHSGDFTGAAEAYKTTVQLSQGANLENITAIAECRINYVNRELHNKATLDTLLCGLP